VSASTWAWMAAFAQVLWFMRFVIGALVVGRIGRIVVEKAHAEDLPEVLTGLGALAGELSGPGRHDPLTPRRAVDAPGGAEAQEDGPTR
jgi:hypothetical protein